jgi:protein-S-isoprenylcysteine O-methyltransferase Ste14
MKFRDINPPNYFLLSLILVTAFHFVLPIKRILHFPWNLLGLLPIAGGIYLNLAADNSFKRRQTTVKPQEKSSGLVTDGVFRISRNPMYLGMVLILAGLALIFGSLAPWLVVILFAFFLDRIFICYEEKNLQETFGKQWSDYCHRVRRWI